TGWLRDPKSLLGRTRRLCRCIRLNPRRLRPAPRAVTAVESWDQSHCHEGESPPPAAEPVSESRVAYIRHKGRCAYEECVLGQWSSDPPHARGTAHRAVRMDIRGRH